MAGSRSVQARLVAGLHKVLVDDQFRLVGVGDGNGEGESHKIELPPDAGRKLPVCSHMERRERMICWHAMVPFCFLVELFICLLLHFIHPFCFFVRLYFF